MFAPFRTGRSNLLWSGVFLVLLVRAILASSNTSSQAQDDLDEKIVQDLKADRRKIFSIGMMKSRLVVLVSHAPVGGFMDENGWYTIDPSLPTTTTAIYAPVPGPDDYYVYDMPSSAFTPTGKLYLHGGVLLKDKWPSLHDWLLVPDNNGKKELDGWLQDYAYMFVSDEQKHDYLVMIEIPTSGYHSSDVASSFLIDKTGGASEQVKKIQQGPKENLKVKICSNEPMSFYYVNVKDGATPQTVPYRLGDSSLGGQPPNRDFALGKQAFNGSTSLAEATGFTNVGHIYAICKSGESEIVTQEARAQLCNEPVDWDIRLGFVDSADRMVLLDEHMTMRSFPRSALTPDGVGKPVKVETVKRGQFLEKGLPPPPSPDSNNQSNNPRGDATNVNGSSSSGLVIGIIVVLVIVVIAALVAAYCFCCKDGKDSAKKGSATPGSKGSGKKGSSDNKKGGSSKKVSGKGSSKGSVKGPSKGTSKGGPSKGSGKGSSQSKKGASSKKVSGKVSSKGSVKGPSKGTSKGSSKGGPSKGGPSKGSVKGSAKVSTKGSSKGRNKRLSKGSVKRSSKRQSKPSSKGKASSKRLTKRSTKLSSKKNSKKSTK